MSGLVFVGGDGEVRQCACAGPKKGLETVVVTCFSGMVYADAHGGTREPLTGGAIKFVLVLAVSDYVAAGYDGRREGLFGSNWGF